jgi:ribosomal protein L19E
MTYTTDEQARADADLIAAAPDLLAALEGVLSAIRDIIDDGTLTIDNVEGHPAIVAAKVAISKARGERGDEGRRRDFGTEARNEQSFTHGPGDW